VQIPHGDYLIPGFLLTPATLNTDCRLLTADHQNTSALSADSPKTDYSPLAVCVVHGAGDTKTSYKWRLVQALLAEGLTVLTIDLPGHGDYRRRPLVVPDCLSAIPAAICFLRRQPGVKRVGLVGISLGSAMAIRSLAEISIDALAALETPIRLKYNRTLFYQEFWNACRAPVLSLLRETTIKQLRQSWYTGGYISQHKNTGEVIELLNPLEGIAHLRMPILLVHGGRDTVAPIAAGQALQQAAPSATLWQVKAASHVTLTLMTQVNRQVARWLKECMGGR
jgi:pimeloyl-ACP methyl ester carboxylesterase